MINCINGKLWVKGNNMQKTKYKKSSFDLLDDCNSCCAVRRVRTLQSRRVVQRLDNCLLAASIVLNFIIVFQV